MKPQNPYRRFPYKTVTGVHAWEEGFDDAVKYMTEPCTKHPDGSNDGFKHRYLCPQCMAEL